MKGPRNRWSPESPDASRAFHFHAPARHPWPCRYASGGRWANERPSRMIFPLTHRSHEDRRHARGATFTEIAIEFLQRLAGPERLLEAINRTARPSVSNRLVYDDSPGQIEANSKPSITSLTTQFACMNRPQRVTSAAGPLTQHFPSIYRPRIQTPGHMTGRCRKSVTQRLKTDAPNLRSFYLKPYQPDERSTLRTATAIPGFQL